MKKPPSKPLRQIGEVSAYSDFTGYGFIKDSAQKSYFVHVSQIQMDDMRTLEVGQKVEFTPFPTFRTPEARDVRVISNEKEIKEGDRSWFFPKKNPFTPQDPQVDAKRFAGRKEPFRNAVDALYNNKNVLISGYRGIGKSSIAYQLLYMTKGERDLVDKLEIDMEPGTFKHLAGSHICVPGNTLLDR